MPSPTLTQHGHYHHHHFQPRSMAPNIPSPTRHHSHDMSPHPHRTSSQDSSDGIRKRVCKACDRCRLKKSKCDGSSPCSRCKADNAICVFGDRKKSQDKVYPKGYVEMLEQQQSQLVEGLQEMYKRLRGANAWEGPVLSESSGHPLTHDILSALHLLESKHDGSGEMETFEEDCAKLQHKLLADGAGYVVRRRGSFSSDSEHSQHSSSSISHTRNGSTHTPKLSISTTPQVNEQLPPPPPQQQQQRIQPTSPLSHDSPITNDVPVYQAPWLQYGQPDDNAYSRVMRSKFALQAPAVATGIPDMDSIFDASQFEETMAFDDFNSSAMSTMMMTTSNPMLQFGTEYGFDPMEFELNKYVAVQ